MGNFNNLEVWKESRQLAVRVYAVTNKGEFIKDYSLKDQIRRSAISVPSNLAEGEESGSQKLSIKYFFIAKASLAELRTQYEIANDIGYINTEDYSVLMENMTSLSKKITRLIQHRQNLIK